MLRPRQLWSTLKNKAGSKSTTAPSGDDSDTTGVMYNVSVDICRFYSCFSIWNSNYNEYGYRGINAFNIRWAGSSIQQLIANSFQDLIQLPILAVPLFIMVGAYGRRSISRRLFSFFAYFVGYLPGGLPCAVIITVCLWCYFRIRTCHNSCCGAMTIPF